MTAYALRGILLGLSFCSLQAIAQQGPSQLNISGGLFNPNGTPVTNSSVNFKLEVWDKNATCLLYTENHNAQNLSTSKGGFSLEIGKGSGASNKIDAGNPAVLSSKVFENPGAVAPFAGCAAGVNLASGDARLIRVYYDLGSGMVAMTPDVPIGSSAYAMVAETLQGKRPADFVQVRDDATYDLNQANIESIFSATNFAKLTALLSGNASNQRLTNVVDPTAASDAATKGYVDNNVGGKITDFTGVGPATGDGKTIIWDQAQNKWVTGTPSAIDASKLPLAGGTMTGAIAMGGNNITNIGHMTMAAQKTLNLGTYTDPQETTLVAGLAAADKGKIWFNSTSNTFKVWDGTAAVGSFAPSGAAGGDLTGTYPNPTIGNSKVVTAYLANDAVTSSKISNTGIAVNRLLITDATTGANVGYANCAIGEILKYGATGWTCSTVASLLGNSGVTAATYGSATQVAQVQVDAQGRVTSASNVAITFPVVSVAGKTGAVTLTTADITNAGTAATKDYGTAAGNLVELDGAGKIPVGLMPTAMGDIQDVVAGSGLTGGGSSGAVTLTVDTGVTAGKIVQMAASDKLPAVDGSNLTNINAVKMQSRDIAATAPGANEVLMWNNSTSVWEPKAIPSAPVSSVATKTGAVTLDWSDILNAAGKYFGYRPNNVACGAGEVLKWNSGASYWECGTDLDSGGDVQSVSAGTGATGGGTSGAVTIGVDVGVTTGKIVQMAASDKLPAVDGSNLTQINAVRLQTRSVSATAPNAGEILKWNNGTSVWEPSPDVDTGITQLTGDVTAGPGSGSQAATIANDKITSAKINSTGIAVNRLLITDATTGANVTYATCAVGEILKWTASGWACGSDIGGSGFVTHIGTGTGLLGGPITSTGTISIDVGVTTGKIVQMAASDKLPAVDGSNLTQINAVKLQARDVSSSAPAADQVLTWNGTTSVWESRALPAGNIGDITSVVNGTGLTGGGAAGDVTLNVDVGVTTGKIIQVAASNKLPVIDGSNLTNINAVQLQSRNVSATAPTANQILKWNNGTSIWEPSAETDAFTGTVTSVVSGMGLLGGNINTSGTLSVDVGTTAGKIVQMAASDKLPAVDGSLLTNLNLSGSNGFIQNGNSFGGAATLGTNDNYALNFEANNATAMTILPNGNLGIGTTSPAAKLDVAGVMRVTDICDETGANCKDISGGWGSLSADIDGVYTTASTGLLGGFVSGSGTLSIDTGVTTGKIIQVAASNKLPVIDGSNLTNINAVQLQSKNVSATAPTANQVLKWNNGTSVWEPAAEADAFTGTVTSVVSGSGLLGGNITSTGTLSVDVGVTTGKIVQMAASDKLPAVDGSNLTQINAVKLQARDVSSAAPAADQVLTWNGTTSVWESRALPAGNIGDITSVVNGTGLTGGGATGDVTLNIDVGVTTGKIIQVAASNKLPVIDGSNLTNLNVSGSNGFVQNGNSFGAAATLGTNDNYALNFEANNATAMTILPSGYVGIGTGNPASLVDIRAATPALTLSDTAASGSWASWSQSAGQMSLRSHAATGSPGLVDLNPTVNDGTSNVTVRVFRTTNTTGSRAFQVLRGDNSTTVDAQISGGTTGATYFAANGGTVGIGTSTPSAETHIFENSNSSTMLKIENQNAGANAFAGVNMISDGGIGYIYRTGTGYSAALADRLVVQDADQISFWVNGGIRQHIANNGYVGINTTNPGAVLDVNGVMRVTDICDETGANCKDISSGWGAGGDIDGVYTTTSTGLLGGFASGSGTLSIDVGTTTGKIIQVAASNKLPAIDGSNLTNVIATSVAAGAGTVGAPSISFSGDPNTGFYNASSNDTISVSANAANIFNFSSAGLVSPTTGGAAITSGNGTVGAPALSFAGDTDTGWWRPAADTMAASTAGAERVRINSTGQVGIATTNPSEQLSLGANASGNSDIGLYRTANTNFGVLRFLTGGTQDWQLGTRATTDSDFHLYSAGTSADAITVLRASGNVGIGTASPTAKLEVDGAIVSQEHVVASGGTADFSNGNSIVLQSVGGSTITVSNMVAGGVYNVVVEDTTSRTYTISGCGTIYWSPANGATTNRSVYTIYRRGASTCFITWTTGFN